MQRLAAPHPHYEYYKNNTLRNQCPAPPLIKAINEARYTYTLEYYKRLKLWRYIILFRLINLLLLVL